MGEIKWKLKEVLEEADLSPRAVENEAIRLGFKFGRNTIYRLLADDGPERLDRATLTALLAALRSLTKKPYNIGDLLEYRE